MTELTSGQALGPRVFRVTRADLVRYAGASGDFNPIHWSDRSATAAGLPGVVAHGMYTLALAAAAVTDWVGDATAVRELSARFSRPVVVPDDDEGVGVEVSGVVTDVAEQRASLELTVTSDGVRVLARARASVALPSRPDA